MKDADLRQRIHHAQAQGIIGRDDHEVDGVVLRPGGDARHVRGLEGHALADRCHAAVAGGRVELGDRGILRNLQGDGVLTATAANDENFHFILLFNTAFKKVGVRRGLSDRPRHPFGLKAV